MTTKPDIIGYAACPLCDFHDSAKTFNAALVSVETHYMRQHPVQWRAGGRPR